MDGIESTLASENKATKSEDNPIGSSLVSESKTSKSKGVEFTLVSENQVSKSEDYSIESCLTSESQASKSEDYPKESTSEIKASKSLLTGAELYEYRFKTSRVPTRGIKEYAPNESWWQTNRMKGLIESRRECISEERVNTPNELMKAVWNNENNLAEVTQIKGKYLQYMGFNVGKLNYLYPEETLFLMDMGVIEVLFHNMSLSMECAYGLFFELIKMEFYQVYANLSRQGYIVRRYRKTDLTQYEVKIGLNLQSGPSGSRGSLKRKRGCDDPDTMATTSKKLIIEKSDVKDDYFDGTESDTDAQHPVELQTKIYWDTMYGISKEWSNRLPYTNFSEIEFPNISNSSSSLSDVPDNTNRESEFSFGANTSKAKNWCQYKNECRDKNPFNPLQNLWSSTFKPLVMPSDATTQINLLKKLKIIDNTRCHNLLKDENLNTIDFDVFLPELKDTFSKKNPGQPAFRVLAVKQNEPPPDLSEIANILGQNYDDAPTIWAVVDHGNIAYCNFSDIDLPIDLFPISKNDEFQ